VMLVWIYIFTQVFRPWKIMINTMNQLSKLETNVEIDQNSKTIELSEMAKALEIFRNNSIMLSSATKKAQKADEAKSMFLANMSHEIRTPLNAIIGFTHILQMRSDELAKEEREDKLNKISASARHLLGVINNILDISKIEAGKLQLELKDFILEDVCKNVYTIISEKSQEKQNEIIINISPDIPSVLVGDDLRLGQVLINLLNNAVKYTEQGTVSLNAKIIYQNNQEYKLLFEVKDTGIGLNEQEQQKLFKAFAQADVSTTRKYGGTGLGLVISKKIIQLMKGDIGVKSEPGKGSNFWFTAYFRKSNQAYYSLKNLSNFSKQRILVVDDSEEICFVHKEILEHMMMRVDTALDGQTAIKMAKQAIDDNDPYSTVIIDWSMPGLNGFETSKQIKELSKNIETIHIMVTAHNELSKEEFKENNIDAVLNKPVTPSLLFDTLIMAHNHNIDSTEPTHESDNTIPDWSAQNLNILVVEDNILNQEVITDILKSSGLHISMANHGQEAVDFLKHEKPDLVLMDLQMPVLDGIEATKQIREFYSADELCIIAMTANAFAEDKERCLAVGMNDHISKPIEPDILFKTLIKCLPKSELKQLSNKTSDLYLKEQFEQIPALNVSEAIIYFQGDYEKYLRQLQSFIKKSNLHIDELNKISQMNQIDATRVAHTIKSTSKTLGINQIYEIAAKLEHALQQQSQDVKALLPLLIEQLNQIIEQLKNTLPETTSSSVNSSNKTFNKSEVDEKLNELLQLLENDDFASHDFFSHNLEMISQHYPKNIEDLQNAIENYDFDTSIDLVKQLINK